MDITRRWRKYFIRYSYFVSEAFGRTTSEMNTPQVGKKKLCLYRGGAIPHVYAKNWQFVTILGITVLLQVFLESLLTGLNLAGLDKMLYSKIKRWLRSASAGPSKIFHCLENCGAGHPANLLAHKITLLAPLHCHTMTPQNNCTALKIVGQVIQPRAIICIILLNS